MDFKTVTLDLLRANANDPLYAPDTRASFTQAARDLEGGKISAEQASNTSIIATLVLTRDFQTGKAFASTVPSETIDARKAYIGAGIEKLLPKLRTQGLSASITAIEGARASGDWAAIGGAYITAQAASAVVDLHIRS